MPGKRVISSSVTLDEAMDDAKFTKDQKEYVKKLIEAGTIQQMFPDAGTGTGAVCTPSGTLNKELIRQQMDKAGKFKGMTDDFISIAENIRLIQLFLFQSHFTKPEEEHQGLFERKIILEELWEVEDYGLFLLYMRD